jgi:hypothetical protein
MDDDSLELLANIRFVKKSIVVEPIKEKKIIDENDEIIELLHERLKLEKNKYGISVKQNKFDNRANCDWELKALEEMLDGLIYTATTIIRYKRKKTNKMMRASLRETDMNETDTSVIDMNETDTSVIDIKDSIVNEGVSNSIVNEGVSNSIDDTNVINIEKMISVKPSIEKNNMSESHIHPVNETKIIKINKHHK